MPFPETQIPMAQPHPTPQKHDSPNANPNGTAQQTADLTKRCTCAVKSSPTLQHLTFPHDSSLFTKGSLSYLSSPCFSKMYYNQELGLCIEFGPVRVDSVRRLEKFKKIKKYKRFRFIFFKFFKFFRASENLKNFKNLNRRTVLRHLQISR